MVLLYPDCFRGGQTLQDQARAEAMKAATLAAMSTLGGRFGKHQHIVVQASRVGIHTRCRIICEHIRCCR